MTQKRETLGQRLPQGSLQGDWPILPIHFQDCLSLAGLIRLPRDHPETAGIERGIRSEELRMIERVVRFQTEFDARALA